MRRLKSPSDVLSAVATAAVPFAAVFVLAACAADSGTSTVQSTDDTTSLDGSAAETTSPVVRADDLSVLPVREGPRRETTGSVPHQQLENLLVAEIDAELLRRVATLPGVSIRASNRSLPGARALWLSDDVDVERADLLGAGREIGHVHPDGSLHVMLPVDRALEVEDKKWGELHPWAVRDGFWDGNAMVYTPETADELEVTMRIVVDAYNFITGENLDPRDFS